LLTLHRKPFFYVFNEELGDCNTMTTLQGYHIEVVLLLKLLVYHLNIIQLIKQKNIYLKEQLM